LVAVSPKPNVNGQHPPTFKIMSNALIIYLHGFNSTGEGSDTVKGLRAILPPDVDLIAPTYDGTNPKQTLNQILTLVRKENKERWNDVVLVGTSLGGFWAETISILEDVRVLIINPARHPSEALKKYMGESKNFNTGETTVVTTDVLRAFKSFEGVRDHAIDDFKPTWPAEVLLWEGDEVLDSKKTAQEMASSFHVTVMPGGRHRVKDYQLVLDSAIKLLNNVSCSLD